MRVATARRAGLKEHNKTRHQRAACVFSSLQGNEEGNDPLRLQSHKVPQTPEGGYALSQGCLSQRRKHDIYARNMYCRGSPRQSPPFKIRGVTQLLVAIRPNLEILLPSWAHALCRLQYERVRISRLRKRRSSILGKVERHNALFSGNCSGVETTGAAAELPTSTQTPEEECSPNSLGFIPDSTKQFIVTGRPHRR